MTTERDAHVRTNPFLLLGVVSFRGGSADSEPVVEAAPAVGPCVVSGFPS
jgi:hypothetical protein